MLSLNPNCFRMKACLCVYVCLNHNNVNDCLDVLQYVARIIFMETELPLNSLPCHVSLFAGVLH